MVDLERVVRRHTEEEHRQTRENENAQSVGIHRVDQIDHHSESQDSQDSDEAGERGRVKGHVLQTTLGDVHGLVLQSREDAEALLRRAADDEVEIIIIQVAETITRRQNALGVLIPVHAVNDEAVRIARDAAEALNGRRGFVEEDHSIELHILVFVERNGDIGEVGHGLVLDVADIGTNRTLLTRG